MPIDKSNPLPDVTVTIYHPTLGTPGGASVYGLSPVRGRILEAGFVPNTAVTSATTLAVATDPHLDSTASSFTNVITSTLGTFSSTNLHLGAPASVVPASPAYVTEGTTIQWTTSGGNTSTIAGTVYAKIRRG